ncbi:MAG: response regulator [Lachnospiraceae bacterium]|nr:response regulator [Lachnospiraceae bacterium]
MFEQAINIFTILVNIVGLMLCLFGYFKYTRRSFVYAVVFFLGDVLSNYYWCVYTLVMGDDPNVSSFLAYFGWNLAFLVMVLMQISMRKEQGIRSFFFLSLLPVPLSIVQLALYLQYGGIFNNIWQVSCATASICLALDSIIYYLKNKKNGTVFPGTAVVIFLYIATEFGYWTASCFDWPSEWLDPYNYFSLINCVLGVFIPIALSKEFGKTVEVREDGRLNRVFVVFRPMFMIVSSGCYLAGFILAVWMKNVLSQGVVEGSESDPYRVIAVVLFGVSLIIVIFTIMVILIVSYEHKNIAKEELEMAKFSAERSNAAKSEFLANMSHEIRTPINAVLGMNEMLLAESLNARDNLPEDRDEIVKIFSNLCNYSGNIDSAGKNLLSIINDILDFSKIEAGKMEIVNSDYKLSSVLNDVSNMISFKAKSKGLSYEVDIDRTLPDGLKGDEVRIRQVITNLLNNAVKYTEKGFVTLSVAADRNMGCDDMILIVISVKDTGMGIKDEERDKLFKKFERMDIEKNSSIEGTGLGLAITGSLVDMMDGTIEVDTEYGKGSTFTIKLPQKVVSKEPIGDFREKYKKSISAMSASKETLSAEGACILVVDDTAMNLTVVKGLLKKTGIKIDTASGGEASIVMARENKYDIILMDQRMPEMDGTTAMNRIKEDPDSLNAGTPFICLTADAISGARERYISEGFDDYLTKPIVSSDLKEKLRVFLPAEKIKN